jgi:glucose/arabinose dehydrogenase
MTFTVSLSSSFVSKTLAVVWAILLVVSGVAVGIPTVAAAPDPGVDTTPIEATAVPVGLTATGTDSGDSVSLDDREAGNGNETDSQVHAVGDDLSGEGAVEGASTQDGDANGDPESSEPADSTVTTAAVETTAAEYRVEPVLSDLVLPVGTVWTPDGRLFVVHKDGRISLYDPATGLREQYMQLQQITADGERGIHAMALDPDFETNGYFYLHYTFKERAGVPAVNVLARFEHRENDGSTSSRGDYSSRTVLWTEDVPATVCCHYGGGLGFGPEGKLFLSTGDHFDPTTAQNTNNSLGKVIRINPDGSIPADNPYLDDPTVPPAVYAIGLRNPYRMSVDPVSGRMYLANVGGNDDITAAEEIELVQRGVNYGWPDCEGACADPQYADPVFWYLHTDVTPEGRRVGGAVTVGPVYQGDMLPADVQGALIYGDYVHAFVRYLVLDENGQVVDDREIFPQRVVDPGVVHYSEGPDGAVYMSNIFGGTVSRIVYDPDNNAPVITEATANATGGPAPLSVAFSGAATDVNGDDLTYTWTFGDGDRASGETAVHTYTQVGASTAQLTVSDGNAAVVSDPIEITVGGEPEAVITTPGDGDTFRAGDTISFTGGATDLEDGQLPPEALTWEVRFVHNDHFHPEYGPTTGTGGVIAIEPTGHDYTSRTGYEIRLTATDSDGLSDTEIVTVYPEKVDLTVQTDPVGLSVDIDNIPRTTPQVLDTLIGFEHLVSAPVEQCDVEGTRYVFEGWSDEGARSHTVTVPDVDATVTATYRAEGVCSTLPTAGLVALFETDRGVTASGEQVTGWPDASGQGNDLLAVGNPTLEAGRLNGQDTVAFDGVDDALVDATPTGLPAGDADRTMFAVVRYDTVGFGGVGYGNNRANEAFTLGVNDAGELTLQGWGSANDKASTVAGTGAGWLVQSVRYDDGAYTMYRNGTAIVDGTHGFATVADDLLLGGNLNGREFVGMEVAAMIVYDRALTETERDRVEAYLSEKYLGVATQSGPSVQFTAPVDGTTARGGVTVAWDATAFNVGDHVHLTVDGQTPHTTIMDLNGSYTYAGLAPGVHTVRIEVASITHDVYTNGGAADEIRVVVPEPIGEPSVPTDGLVLRLESDGLHADGTGVTSWRDDTRRANHLSAVGSPQLATDGPAGGTYVAFEPGDALVRTAGVRGLPAGDADRTVFAVVRHPADREPRSAGVTYGRPAVDRSFGLSAAADGRLRVATDGVAGFDADLPASGTGWYVQSATHGAGTLAHYRDGIAVDTRTATLATRNGRLAIGAGLDGSPGTSLDVAAVLVYDRALSQTDRLAVESYLARTYLGVVPPVANEAPTAADDALTVEYVTAGTVDVLANDVDADGTLDPWSVSFETMPDHGKVALVDAGVVRYTHFGEGLTDSFQYVVYDDEGAASNVATVAVTIDDGSANEAPTAADDTTTVAAGESVAVDVLANDADADGSLDPTTVQIVTAPAAGSATVLADGRVAYAHDGGNATADEFTYAVADDRGTVSNVATVSVAILPPAPAGLVTDGLVVWLDDASVASTGGAVSGWTDRSGSGNDLTAVGGPSLAATPTGRDAVAFDGVDDRLERTDALTGLPAGGDDRTMFAVVRYDSVGFGGMAYGAASRNEAFGLVVSDDGRATLQGWGGPNDYPFGAVDEAVTAGWMVQAARLSADDYRHLAYDNRTDEGGHAFDTRLARIVLGAELNRNAHVDMRVAAVLVYDRALSDTEFESVRASLQSTYVGEPVAVTDAPVTDDVAVQDGLVEVTNGTNESVVDPATDIPTDDGAGGSTDEDAPATDDGAGGSTDEDAPATDEETVRVTFVWAEKSDAPVEEGADTAGAEDAGDQNEAQTDDSTGVSTDGDSTEPSSTDPDADSDADEADSHADEADSHADEADSDADDPDSQTKVTVVWADEDE